MTGTLELLQGNCNIHVVPFVVSSKQLVFQILKVDSVEANKSFLTLIPSWLHLDFHFDRTLPRFGFFGLPSSRSCKTWTA